MNQRPLRVFLCHSSGDKPAVRELYRRLEAEKGIQPWLDEEDLLPGQDWEREIRKAVAASDTVIVCISERAASKAGFLQKEIKYALDQADQQPPGTIFLIPLRLEECEVPERFRPLQWVNYYEDQGYNRLMRALRVRASGIPEVQAIDEAEPVRRSDSRKQRQDRIDNTRKVRDSARRSVLEDMHLRKLPQNEVDKKLEKINKITNEDVFKWAQEHVVNNPFDMGPKNWQRCLYDLGAGGENYPLEWEESGYLKYQ